MPCLLFHVSFRKIKRTLIILKLITHMCTKNTTLGIHILNLRWIPTEIENLYSCGLFEYVLLK